MSTRLGCLFPLVAGLVILPLAGSLASVQEADKEPKVFRKVELGASFPTLEVLDLEGKGTVFEALAGEPSIVALLRPDQESSLAFLDFATKLVIDKAAPSCQVHVIGMKGRGGRSWDEIGKGLPRRVSMFLDAGKVASTLGVIVLPSIALLDDKGQLYRAYVLYDEEGGARIRNDLALVAGVSAELSPEEQARRRFAELDQSAGAFEAAGQLQDALVLRRLQVELGVEEGQALFLLGNDLFKLGKFREAEAVLRRSVELESGMSARVLLGRSLARLGELGAARAVLQEALPVAPQKAVLHRELAEICKQEGKLDQALEHLKQAVAALQANGKGESHE